MQSIPYRTGMHSIPYRTGMHSIPYRTTVIPTGGTPKALPKRRNLAANGRHASSAGRSLHSAFGLSRDDTKRPSQGRPCAGRIGRAIASSFFCILTPVFCVLPALIWQRWRAGHLCTYDVCSYALHKQLVSYLTRCPKYYESPLARPKRRFSAAT